MASGAIFEMESKASPLSMLSMSRPFSSFCGSLHHAVNDRQQAASIFGEQGGEGVWRINFGHPDIPTPICFARRLRLPSQSYIMITIINNSSSLYMLVRALYHSEK
ncbi:uncharacterized protein ARMOST_14177 [Armillaria ostoyae]|uniref:Uncharacterized protein n=1 Tax=Armillaria ostoyae TaxID=47428 RepID=A0A284RPW4_ARMOS|nr:uncharacterized protein ARMOST_14177 [Armillaria ostoyae]